MPVMDTSDPSFHMPTAKKDQPAVWERALQHDSIDLIDMYLQDFRVDNTLRGQMLLDLMDQTDPQAVKWMVKAWLEVMNEDQWRPIIEPYVGVSWRPLNNCWEAGEPEAGLLKHKGLDPIIWKCRSRGLKPAVRRAIVRDLMSQPSEDAYKQLYRDLDRTLDGYIPNVRNSRAARKTALADLTKNYMEMTDFGSMLCISEADIEGAMQGISMRGPTAIELMREIRRCPDQATFNTMVGTRAVHRVMTRGYNA